MTKEMRPSHRTDVLAHALVYYGIKTKLKLGKCVTVHCIEFYQCYCVPVITTNGQFGVCLHHLYLQDLIFLLLLLIS